MLFIHRSESTPSRPSASALTAVFFVLMQMPKGVPVATVAIGNAANAGLLALRILAGSDTALQQRLLDYQVHKASYMSMD